MIRSLQSVCYDAGLFAVLVVDDGSSESMDAATLLNRINGHLNLTVISLPVNQGITRALNAGLQWLAAHNNFKYVARLDAGDTCDARRFYEQVDFMNRFPGIDLLGSWCVFKNFKSGNSFRYQPPGSHERIIKQMHFRNAFIPSTVMWRASAKNNSLLFSEKFPHAEDYAFFYTIINNGRAAVIPKKLVTCEIDYGSISYRHRNQQLKSRISVVRHYGTNRLLVAAGTTWVRLLNAFPDPLMMRVKQLLS